MHLFISYAKRDTRALALRLRDALAALPDVTVWMDESLEAASSWASQIQEEIDRCDYLIVLLSPDVNRRETETQARSFVLNEVDYAQQIRKPIIPVMAQATRVPVQLAGIQFIDFTQDEAAGIKRLIRRVMREGDADSEEDRPHRALPPSPRRRIRREIVVAAALGVAITLVAAGIALFNRAGDPRFAPTLDAPTPNFFTQAAVLATELAATERATVIPTLDATALIATNIANLKMTETAKYAPTSDLSATANAALTQTEEALAATRLFGTQVAQLTANAPTNTPPPSPTPAPTARPSPTPGIPRDEGSAPESEGESAGSDAALLADAQATTEAQMLAGERVPRAAMRITTAFEGRRYNTVTTFDSSIVGYGLFSFSVADGTLSLVIERYSARSDSPLAGQLAAYAERVAARDATLRDDAQFHDLLAAAGDDPVMQQVQDELAIEQFWNPTVEISINPRGIRTPLGQALLFDLAILYGLNHNLIRQAEQNLGVPERSQVGVNGITDEALIAEVARLNQEALNRQAERDNLPGLRRRGDFWAELVARGDWDLQGNADGNVEVRQGQLVQVRAP